MYAFCFKRALKICIATNLCFLEGKILLILRGFTMKRVFLSGFWSKIRCKSTGEKYP